MSEKILWITGFPLPIRNARRHRPRKTASEAAEAAQLKAEEAARRAEQEAAEQEAEQAAPAYQAPAALAPSNPVDDYTGCRAYGGKLGDDQR